MGFKTNAVQKGVYADKTFNSVTTPIYTTSTFAFEKLGEMPSFDYTRSGNPTRHALEQNLAALEGGAGAAIFCTGMAAVTTSMFLFSPGDHIIAGDDIYGGTYRLFDSVLTSKGYEFSFVNMRDPKAVQAAVKDNTRCIWIETPSNPLMNLTDIEAIAAIARKAGAITIADNTFMSPYFQRPLDLGVDIVLHSTTKYINGHSDVVGGAVISKSEEHAEKIKELINALGTACSPFDAWLVLRGVKTLPYRMEGHAANAQAIAEFLEGHARVKKVYYPGLKSHPQHDLAKKQMSGFGGMLSFEMDIDKVDPNAFCDKLCIFHLAESLGGVESLLCQPWSMTHASMPEHARVQAGISPATIRVSVGLEDAEDLIGDLEQALK